MRTVTCLPYVLVRWLGRDASGNSWEQLVCAEAIAAFVGHGLLHLLALQMQTAAAAAAPPPPIPLKG